MPRTNGSRLDIDEAGDGRQWIDGNVERTRRAMYFARNHRDQRKRHAGVDRETLRYLRGGIVIAIATLIRGNGARARVASGADSDGISRNRANAGCA